MAIENYYKTINKLSNIKKNDGRGGYVYDFSIISTFNGLVNQASSKEQELAKKLGITADFKLYCEVEATLTINDIIQFNDEYYRVVSKPKNTIQRNHHLKITLKQISLDNEEIF